jgi:hypothetical protein
MIYGYASQQLSDEGLLEMREVSFDFPASALREVADFLNSCAELLEKGEFRHSHLHIRSCTKWRFLDTDIIVLRSEADA